MSDTAAADPHAEDAFEQQAPPRRWYQRLSLSSQNYALRIMVGLFLFLFIALYFWPDMFITVKSGEVGVLYMRFGGGTQTDRVIGQGMKVIAPWDKLFIYDVRVQEVKHEMDVLTNEGLSVKLTLSIRYHPEIDLVGLLHDRIGPDYRDKVVIPEVESALRTTMGKFPMRDVYGSQRGVVQQAINESLEQVEQKFVKVDDVVLRAVELPEEVRNVIEDKMKQKELLESYEYRLEVANKEAQRRQVEAGGIKAYNDILNSSLTASVLRWAGIEATKEFARSPNAKTIILGSKDSGGLPLIIGQEK